MSRWPPRTLAVFALLAAVAGYCAITSDRVVPGRPPPARPVDEARPVTFPGLRRVRALDAGPTLEATRAAWSPRLSSDILRIFVSAEGALRTDGGPITWEELFSILRRHADGGRDDGHAFGVSTRSVLVVAEREATWGPVRSVLQACSHFEVRIWRTFLATEGRSPVRAFLDPVRLRDTESRVKREEEPAIWVGLSRSETEPRTRVRLLGSLLGEEEAAFRDLERRLAVLEASHPTSPGGFYASADVPFPDVLRAFAAFRRQGIEEIRFVRVPPGSWAAYRAEELEREGRDGEAIQEWIRALEGTNLEVRERAVQRLIEFGGVAVQAVVEALDADTNAGRTELVNVLEKSVSPTSYEAIPTLIRELSDRDTCDAASRALVKIGPSAAPALVEVLPLGWAGWKAADTLLSMEGDTVPALEWGLVRGETTVARVRALDLLVQIAPPEEARRTISLALDDPHDRLRQIAKNALRKLGESQVGEQNPGASSGE
jgi:hypothetical protein